MEDGTSFSGNSNNVFTTSGGVGSGGHGVGGPGNAHGGVAGGVIAGGEHLMMSSSAASTAKANNSSSNCHNDAATNNRLMFTIGSYEDSRFVSKYSKIKNRCSPLNKHSPWKILQKRKN